MSDLPFEEIAAMAQPLVDTGATVFFKYTCAGCGDRKIFEEPNTLYKTALCDRCGHETDLTVTGAGFMLVI